MMGGPQVKRAASQKRGQLRRKSSATANRKGLAHAAHVGGGSSGRFPDCLVGTGGAVEGMAVASAGQPMADVRVFNSGDAPEAVSIRTGPAGRFRLEGRRSGPVYVFAEKADCRFTGLRTTSGATGVAIKLLRKDEPLPVSAQRPEPPYEAQQKLGHKFLKRLWATGTPRPSRARCSSWPGSTSSRPGSGRPRPAGATTPNSA